MSDITFDQAQAAVAAAVRKARELSTLMDIAVVDAGANLKAFVRMDGAWLGSVDISMKKARTARFFDMNTGDIGARTRQVFLSSVSKSRGRWRPLTRPSATLW